MGSFQLPRPREATLGSPLLLLSCSDSVPKQSIECAKASFLHLQESGPPWRQESCARLVRAFQGHLAQICHFSERQVEPQRRGEIFQGRVAKDSCRPRPKRPDSKASAPWATATCLPVRSMLRERDRVGVTALLCCKEAQSWHDGEKSIHGLGVRTSGKCFSL